MYGLTPPELFPPMREQPSFEAISSCLDRLRISAGGFDGFDGFDGSSCHGADSGADSHVWDWTTPQDEIEAASAAAALRAQRTASAVARYLGSIVTSDLAWLGGEDRREALWAAASQRISERCGRAAMGEITRRWPLTVEEDGEDRQKALSAISAPPSGAASDSGCGRHGSSTTTAATSATTTVDLVLREPALVGDSLGFKTWGTAYVMARMLPALAATSQLRHLGLQEQKEKQEKKNGDAQQKPEPEPEPNPAILELGAGTGLLGLAAAVLWRADVVLTDLAVIVPNLAANVARNAAVVEARGGRARAAVLQWGGRRDADCPEEADPELFVGGDSDKNGSTKRRPRFPLILAADPLYDDEHAPLLAGAIDEQLTDDDEADARALVMVPLRDRHTEEIARAFVAAMAARALVVADEGRAAGQDTDWGGAAQFPCWWWVFRRAEVVEKQEA